MLLVTTVIVAASAALARPVARQARRAKVESDRMPSKTNGDRTLKRWRSVAARLDTLRPALIELSWLLATIAVAASCTAFTTNLGVNLVFFLVAPVLVTDARESRKLWMARTSDHLNQLGLANPAEPGAPDR